MARKDGALEVRARLEDDPDGGLPPDEIVAYAFAANGKLLDSKPLKDGVARLKVPIGDEPAPGRVLIGPRVGDDIPLIDELLRRGAWEEHIRLEPKLPPLDILIPPVDWLCWILSRCTVRGTLLKRTVRNGITVDLPVCDADVEIYEVDPLPILLPRIPDDILDRIREILIKQPIPIPDPIPDPDPGPILPPHGPGPGPDPAPFFGMHAEHAAAPVSATAELKQAPAPEAMRMALELADSHDAIRQVLLAHPIVIRPLICRFFPRLVTKTLLGTAHTDDCGHFRFTFFRGCHNPDQPDLYFKATQQWFFGRITVLEPLPVACHTWWNYVCGTEVTLYATNPLTLTCAPCGPVVAPDNYVMVFGIGRHSAHAIHGASADLSNGSAERGLTSDGRPWAGDLRLRLDFDPGIRDALGIRYYRVSWRKAGGTFQPVTVQCHRHYRVVPPGGGIAYVGYLLGPHVVGPTAGLFEVPPALPPAGNWVVVDPVEDTTNARFQSGALVPGVAPSSATDNAGVHELKIELFDGAGNPVDAAALGVQWVIPDVDDLGTGGTIHGEAPVAGAVVGGAFVLPLHVDNNKCEAEIGAPTLNGSAAADACGVMRYPAAGGTVEMPFRAAHRNGFATRSFTVRRGAEPPMTPAVMALGGGNFSASSTVAALRGSCTIAAFAESLYVAATATDGWGRQSQLDDDDVRAFTLAPQP